MKAFIWRDAYPVEYGRGDVVAVASSVEEARVLARVEQERHMRGRPAGWVAFYRRALEADPEIVLPGAASSIEWSE